MHRIPRMVINDETTVYHVMSRTALDGFPLGDIEKDFMLDLIKKYSKLYLVEILGFCLMGNHLLVKMIPEYKVTDEDIKKRYESFYGDDRAFAYGQIPYKTRYFTDSGIIGTKEFVSVNYKRFKDIFMSKRKKVPKPVAGLDGIYSLKRLTEQ